MSVPTADPSRVELRGDIDRDVADVLDAVAKARRVSRMDVVASVLGDWAKDKIHESTIVLRLARGVIRAGADLTGKRDGTLTERGGHA